MTEAQELITSLMASGMSYADIGRSIGRDPSYIRQAMVPNSKGYVKPARPAVPALQQLSQMRERGQKIEKPVDVPRRSSKHGGLANVRGGLIEQKAGGAWIQTKHESFLLKQVREAAGKGAEGQWVNMKLRFTTITWGRNNEKEKHADVSAYKRGYHAKALLRRVEAYAKEKGVGEEQALKDILREDTIAASKKRGGSAGIKKAGKVEKYEMETSDEAFAA